MDDKEDLSIDYKLKEGDYIGRIPSKVIAYYQNDSLIIAEVKSNFDKGKDFSYYILKTNLDHEFAQLEKGILIGPLDKKEYDSAISNLNVSVTLKKVGF